MRTRNSKGGFVQPLVHRSVPCSVSTSWIVEEQAFLKLLVYVCVKGGVGCGTILWPRVTCWISHDILIIPCLTQTTVISFIFPCRCPRLLIYVKSKGSHGFLQWHDPVLGNRCENKESATGRRRWIPGKSLSNLVLSFFLPTMATMVEKSSKSISQGTTHLLHASYSAFRFDWNCCQ